MGMTSLSIILTVFVLQLYHVTPRQRPVPPWLRHFMFQVVAPALRMRDDVEGYRTCAAVAIFDATDNGCKSESSVPQQSTRHDDRNFFIDNVSYGGLLSPDVGRQSNGLEHQPATASARHLSDDWCGRHHDNRTLYSSACRDDNVKDERMLSSSGLVRIAIIKVGSASCPATASVYEEDDSIASDLKVRQTITNEWKLVALIMDRLLFVLFLVISSLSTVGILVIQPLTKPSIIE